MTGTELFKELLKMYEAAYTDASTTFAGIDSKAQNTISLAGIFLGALFAFFNGTYLSKVLTTGGSLSLYLFGGVILLLLTSVFYCLQAMWIRDVSLNDIEPSSKEIEDILDTTEDELESVQQNYYRGVIGRLRKVVAEFRAVNVKKGTAIWRGQIVLTAAILLIGVILLIILFNVNDLPVKTS